MMPTTVENPRYVWEDSSGIEFPMLLVDLDGLTVAIDEEQKLLLAYNIVILSSWPSLTGDDEDRHEEYEAIIPAGADQRYNWPESPVKVSGATNDPRVLRLVRRFWEDIRDETFRPGRVEL